LKSHVPAYGHPFFLATLPGLAGVVVGVSTAVSGSLFGYHMTEAILSVELPNDPSRALWGARLAALIPWGMLFTGFLVSVILMTVYKRNLRRNAGHLAMRLVLTWQEKKQCLSCWKILAIEWPVLAALAGVLATNWLGSSMEAGLWQLSFMSGVLTGAWFTWPERKVIYNKAAGLVAVDGALTRKAKTVAKASVVLVAIYAVGNCALTWYVANLAKQLHDLIEEIGYTQAGTPTEGSVPRETPAQAPPGVHE
jgi:hypothetical protein